MLCLFIILSFVSGAYLSDIIARGDTSVVFGGDASFSCALSNPSGVKQVTWQRVRADERPETLATFSERYKDTVDDQYVGKVTLTMASSNSTSIVIKNVTFEDEACYVCSFNTYPLGSKWQSLCLSVKGISEITASVNPSNSSDSDVTVSCSATGKPTPILQWKFTEIDLIFTESQILTKFNSDGSNTTTSKIKLPLSQFHGKHIECVAQSDNVEDRYQIYVHGGDNDEDNVNNVTSRNYIITILVLVIMLIIIIVFTVICLYKRLNGVIFRLKPISAELLPDQVEMGC